MNTGLPYRTPGGFETLARFLCVGGIATILQYLLLIALVRWLSVEAVMASSIAYATAATYNYVASHAFTFRSSRAHLSALPRFLCMLTVGFTLNAAVVWFFFQQVHLHYLLAQLLATTVTLCWNYLASLYWAFAT